MVLYKFSIFSSFSHLLNATASFHSKRFLVNDLLIYNKKETEDGMMNLLKIEYRKKKITIENNVQNKECFTIYRNVY